MENLYIYIYNGNSRYDLVIFPNEACVIQILTHLTLKIGYLFPREFHEKLLSIHDYDSESFTVIYTSIYHFFFYSF